MYLYLLTLHSERQPSSALSIAMKGDRIIPRPAGEVGPPQNPGTWFVGTQQHENLQLRSVPHVNERDKWDVHGYRFVKMEQDIDTADLENALNTYYTEIMDMTIPNCTNTMKVKVTKFTFSGDEISKEMTSVFGNSKRLDLNSPLAAHGSFHSPYSECSLTTERLESTIEYVKSYISMMTMREKIMGSSAPKVLEVEEMAESGPVFGNISNNAVFRDEVATYESEESKKPEPTALVEKLVFIKWNEENDVKFGLPGLPGPNEEKPSGKTSLLDAVFGYSILKPKEATINPTGPARVPEKELYLMPCGLTKYLGTEFCPEFIVESPFKAGGASALTTLYKAMVGTVPKFSRDMLEKALEAIPGPEAAVEEAEVEVGDDECKTCSAEANVAEETKEEGVRELLVKTGGSSAEEIAVDELCEAVMLEVDKTIRDTKMRALQAYYDKWVAGVGHTSKDQILKQITGLKVWLENEDKKANPQVRYLTPEEKAAADKEAAKAKIREVNEQMKKMRELQAIWADASATVDEKAAAQKEILDICAKQVEASTLKRDPIEEVLENLWGFFRQEMLSTYKKSGAMSKIEFNWNRQKWMILANWLQIAMAPKSTYFSKIDAYGATYFGKKPLPDEYMSLATVKLATEKYKEYMERYKAQIGEDEDIQLNPGLISMSSLREIGLWKGPKEEALSGTAIRAYILFRCMPNTLSAEEKLIVTRAFASKRTKADSTATVGSQQMYNEFLGWMTDDLKFTPEQVKAVKAVFPIGELSNYMKQAGYSMTRRATGMVYLNTQLVAETPAVKIRDAKNFTPSSDPSENTLPGYDFSDPFVTGGSSFAAFSA